MAGASPAIPNGNGFRVRRDQITITGVPTFTRL
jgi:hypothetical protein